MPMPAGTWAACAPGSAISPRLMRNSSLIVLAQKTTAKPANSGHSNVYAQLRALPESARWNCQSPSQSMPQKDTTISRCQPIQRGWIKNRHTGPDEGDGCDCDCCGSDGCGGTVPGLGAAVPAFSMP